MKTILYKYTGLLLLVAALIGCSKDFTDRPPEDRLTVGTYFYTDDEVLMATAPLYNSVWFDFMNNVMPTIGDARGGNMISNDRWQFYQWVVPEGRFEVWQSWRSFYNTIGQCNLILRNLKTKVSPAVSKGTINHAMAEARFMRGLAYSWLVMNWGPVPIIYDNIDQMTDTTIARNTQESVWELIIRDLTYASDNLPETPVAVARLSKWSAKGMLAKMYLYRAGFKSVNGVKDEADLAKAVELAGDVCKNSGLNLFPDYYALFLSRYENNQESLFSLQWIAIDVWGVKNTFQAFFARNPDITGTGDGWGAAHGCSADLLKYYIAHPEDSIRRRATFMFDSTHYPEICSTVKGFNLINPEGTGYTYADSTICNIKKYIVGRPADNDGVGVNMGTGINTYMLRLAEVYLIYAEALLGNDASTTNPDALHYFNLVRTRAQVPVKTELTFMDILWEKRIEFAMEGLFWNELVHWYYFDPDAAINFINNQDKGIYRLVSEAATGNTWKVRYPEYTVSSAGDTVQEVRYFAVTTGDPNLPNPRANFWFPYPELEMTAAPNLRKPPVSFDFALLKEE